MKLKVEPPEELKALGDSMQKLLAVVAGLAIGAFALALASLLISLGGRSNAN